MPCIAQVYYTANSYRQTIDERERLSLGAKEQTSGVQLLL